jgi:hypothetical protein
LEVAARARRRWDEGREERGLDPDAPFVGHPVAEFEEEILDALNYLEVMFQQDWIDELVAHRSRGMLLDLMTMAQTAGAPDG